MKRQLVASGSPFEDTIGFSRWEQVARAHAEAFGAVRPASTFVEVNRLIDAEWLVEIEADALVEQAA